MQRTLYGVTAMTLLSYAGEYMAFTSILAWLDLLLLQNGYNQTDAYGFSFIVSAGYLLISGVLAIPLGFVADVFGRRKTGAAGCVLAGVAILLVSVTGQEQGAVAVIVTISLLLLIVGVGHATYTVSALAYAGDVSNEDDVGEAYGLVETAEYAMFMFGTPLGGLLATLYGNVGTFYITGGVLMVGALACLLGMPERGRARNAVFRTTMDSSGDKAPSTFRLMLKGISNHEVQASLLAIFFVSMGFTVFRVYVTVYGTTGPYIVGIMALASILVAVPVGRLLDRTKKRALYMAAGFLVEGLALFSIFYGPSSVSVLLWAVVFGVAIMLVRVPQAVVIAEKTVVDNRASAMGANHGVEHIGYGVGAFLGGALILGFGFSTLGVFWLVAGVSAAFGLVLIPLSRLLKMQ